MADDAGIGVGGDGSVAWRIQVAHVRKGSIVSRPVKPGGFLQSGVDETEPGNFTIGVQVPRTGGEQFAQALQRAAEEARRYSGQPGYRVTFPLVIEPRNENQITVTWKSAPLPPRRYAATEKAAPQKAAPKKKAVAMKKAAPKKKAAAKKRR
jgi:hypothetical protein